MRGAHNLPLHRIAEANQNGAPSGAGYPDEMSLPFKHNLMYSGLTRVLLNAFPENFTNLPGGRESSSKSQRFKTLFRPLQFR